MKIRYDTVRLVLAHALMNGHTVETVENEEYEHKPSDIESFGFFDASSPNYVAFNPDVDKASFTPKDEDFIYPTFRLLSETIVHKHWNPIDFGEDGVLKKSMAMMNNQVIYPDHEKLVANGMGAILSTKWQAGYKLNGKDIPAGMVGTLKLDAKSNPRVARLLLMEPPGIHSVSATVKFSWKKSHDLEDSEFYNKLGTYDKEGQMIRRIVTDVLGYSELSLVPHGADPYAKMLKGGKLASDNILDKTLSADKDMVFDYADIPENKLNSISLSLKTDKRMEFTFLMAIQALSEKLGVTLPEDFKLEELTQEQFTEMFLEAVPAPAEELPENLSAIQERFPELTADRVAELEENQPTEEQTGILQQVTDLGGIEAIGSQLTEVKTHVDSLRAETLSNYNLSVGEENAAQPIISMIEKADITQLNALNSDYKTRLEGKVPLICQDCGSEEVSRETFVRKPGGEYDEGFMEKARKSKEVKPSTIHK